MAALGPLTLIVVAALAFLLASIAQSVTGFGSALVAAPLLALVTDVRTSVVAVTLASLALTGGAAARERAHIDIRLARSLSLVGFVGLPIGLLLLAHARGALLSVLMASTVVAALIVVVAEIRLPERWLATASTGLLSGVLLTSTGMNGPPLVMGLSSIHDNPKVFRATLQVVLFTQDVVGVVGFLAIGHVSARALVVGIVGGVVSPIGWVFGDRIFVNVSAAAFRGLLIAGLTASAAALVISAL